MIEEVMNNWALKFQALLDSTNFLSFPQDPRSQELRITNSELLVGFFILFWGTIHLIYEKCLHLLLRRMRISLTQRLRIVNAVWSCGFCFGSICYLKLANNPAPDFSSELGLGRSELGLILHKSYYFHQAGLEVFYHGAWLKGWANLLFPLLFDNFNRQMSCSAVTGLLFYKAVDSLTMDVCRILLSVSHSKLAKLATKLVFFSHCLNWIYIYVLLVPDYILWPDNTSIIPSGGLYLWMWFVSECCISVWIKLLGCIDSNEWLEACLFPPPTEEAIQLASIRKRYRDSLKSTSNASSVSKKTELWHTLLCAMAIKKKIKRLRQAKLNGTETSGKFEKGDKVEEDETDVDKCYQVSKPL